MTVFNWLEKLCMYVPDKIALKEFETGRTLTYRQLDNISNRLSRQFTADLGIARGDRIALYADNCLEHFILFFVAQKTGAIIVPLNYRLAAKEIHQVLLDCTPKLLITEEKYLPNVAQFPLPASITHQWTLQELQQAGYAQRDLPESFTPIHLMKTTPSLFSTPVAQQDCPKACCILTKCFFGTASIPRCAWI
jgi:fatty-acyl-CoA synthase